jgi:hypothetical protein
LLHVTNSGASAAWGVGPKVKITPVGCSSRPARATPPVGQCLAPQMLFGLAGTTWPE